MIAAVLTPAVFLNGVKNLNPSYVTISFLKVDPPIERFVRIERIERIERAEQLQSYGAKVQT